jgi:hypothetical protein
MGLYFSEEIKGYRILNIDQDGTVIETIYFNTHQAALQKYNQIKKAGCFCSLQTLRSCSSTLEPGNYTVFDDWVPEYV